MWIGYGLLALLVFLPHLVWNADNDWLSLRFQLGHGFATDHIIHDLVVGHDLQWIRRRFISDCQQDHGFSGADPFGGCVHAYELRIVYRRNSVPGDPT